MVLKNTSYKVGIAVLLLALSSAPVRAEESLKPLTIDGRYSVAWSGITIGRIIIHAHEDASSYAMSVDTKTKGVGSWISDEAGIVKANGTKKPDGTYVPVSYHSGPQGDSDRNSADMAYDAEGNIATRSRKREDDPAWRPMVPNEEINTARDPITASFMLRRKLHAAIAAGEREVSTRTYDASRLANMKMTRAPNAKVEVMGMYKDAVNVMVTREPLNGYTPKELKKYKKGDPTIHLYFTNDDAFMPIRATAKTLVGELSLTLIDDKAK